ncbi:hypothetical protein VCRA2114E365_60035 [Vibrio crassostreae]|nr:hypothetical protein VCRA2117O378_300036 [Vibrio crassostreae]CAK2042957.1 hypothetical protein VCRA2119O381_30126 [Vibrio crassostreae]CAK2165595.1 hypothetical protein VCRA2113O357_60035 [Vibrio crassostreae]CAK2166164.1 hypothetical protein VCRA2117O376_60036 [Vibrio crassostreae]CAK2171078.1 hypothetical protein VCRA2113O351_60035 [Vibrio crassostreae]
MQVSVKKKLKNLNNETSECSLKITDGVKNKDDNKTKNKKLEIITLSENNPFTINNANKKGTKK